MKSNTPLPLAYKKKHSHWDDTLSFGNAFLNQPFSTGAIAPSSKYLAQRMVADLDLDRAKHVVELGPGTGAITQAILGRLKEPSEYLGIDLNPIFIQRLRLRFPDACFHLGSAERLRSELNARQIETVDFVISSLPWTLFSPQRQHTILTEIALSLSTQGEFTTFAYVHSLFLPNWRRFRRVLNEHFNSVSQSRIIWANFPPAVICHCKNS